MATLGELRANVRRNLGESTAQFYTNAELNQTIGEAYRFFSMIMIEEGDGYFEVTTNLGFTANDPQVSLSALSPTFYHVSSLERNLSWGTIPLEKSERRYKANLVIGAGVGDSYIPTYKFQSNYLILEPTPQTTEAASSTTGLKLDYVYMPTFPVFDSADSFEFDANFPILYEPMIELYATIAALESKDGMGGVSDINSFRGRLEKWQMQFISSLERSEYSERVEYMGGYYGPGSDNYNV